MNATRFGGILMMLGGGLAAANQAFAQGTAFVYQGRLNDSGSPANGKYDLQFKIFDAVTNGNQLAVALTNAPTGATNGLFAVTLDFGAGVFTGAARWLEIGVRTNGSAVAYVILSPRQALTAAPYAVTAAGISGTLPATQLSGAIPSGQLGGTYTGSVAFSNSANRFVGDAGGLSNLPATMLSGAVPVANGGTGQTNAAAALAALGGANLTGSNLFTAGTNSFQGLIVSNLQVGASPPDTSSNGVGRPGFTGDVMDINVTGAFPTIQILQTTPSLYENGAGIRLKSVACGGVDWIISSGGPADIRGAGQFALWNNAGYGKTNPGTWFWINPAGDVWGNSFNAASATFTNLTVGTGLASPGDVANFFTAADRSVISISVAPYTLSGTPTAYGSGAGLSLNSQSVGGGSWYELSEGDADPYPGNLSFISAAGGGNVRFDTGGNMYAPSVVATSSVTTANLIYTATNAPPANPNTPVRWMQVTVGGTNYEVPLYK